jgi:thiosulfate/3-mercaptopyruvate sulfurtransferase
LESWKIMGRIWITLVRAMALAIALGLLLGPALAGTETGEFCPTCPDWTNLEGWLAQKEAYERAHQSDWQKPNDNNNNDMNTKADNTKSDMPIVKPVPTYPASGIISLADSSFDGRVIIDVRDPDDYQSGHIPGARNLYWGDLQRGDSLDPALAEGMLRKAGINNSDFLLIYGDEEDEDEGADYVFWALSYLGHENLSKLSGGVDAAWGAGIRPTVSQPLVAESNYTVHLIPWLLVNKSSLKSLLELPGLQILDARDFADYGMSRLTNASIPFEAEKLYDDLLIKDAATLEELLERRGLEKDGVQLVYGTPQAYSLFYGLKLMGYNATLIGGDWWQKTEWAVNNVR